MPATLTEPEFFSHVLVVYGTRFGWQVRYTKVEDLTLRATHSFTYSLQDEDRWEGSVVIRATSIAMSIVFLLGPNNGLSENQHLVSELFG